MAPTTISRFSIVKITIPTTTTASYTTSFTTTATNRKINGVLCRQRIINGSDVKVKALNCCSLPLNLKLFSIDFIDSILVVERDQVSMLIFSLSQ